MKKDGILKFLTEDDIPESCAVLIDYLDINVEWLQGEPFYVGDGMDLFRYLVKHLEGLQFRIPRLRTMQKAHRRYLEARRINEPEVSLPRLALDTGLDEKTIREYLRDMP